MKLTDNIILVTGGSSGIGLALTKKFLSLGNRVLITGRDDNKLSALKREFPRLDTFCGDITQENSLLDLVHYITNTYPYLNVLVNNAAVQYNYLFEEAPNLSDRITYEINTNLTAPIRLTHLLLPHMKLSTSAAVVNISSALIMAPKKTAAVYCATKAGLHSYSKTLRYQLEETPVKVFEVIPPLVDTPMTAGRGSSKWSSEQVADAFIKNFRDDIYESYLGRAKLLKYLHRIFPGFADQLMKNGL